MRKIIASVAILAAAGGIALSACGANSPSVAPPTHGNNGGGVAPSLPSGGGNGGAGGQSLPVTASCTIGWMGDGPFVPAGQEGSQPANHLVSQHAQYTLTANHAAAVTGVDITITYQGAPVFDSGVVPIPGGSQFLTPGQTFTDTWLLSDVTSSDGTVSAPPTLTQQQWDGTQCSATPIIGG